MAAWEFAAGRFPDCRATLFCLPLVALGTVLAPFDTFEAFVLGRNSKSLYGRQVNLEQSVASLRASTLPTTRPEVRVQDRLAFMTFVAASSLEIALPFPCVFMVV